MTYWRNRLGSPGIAGTARRDSYHMGTSQYMWNLLPLWSGQFPWSRAAGGTLSGKMETVMLELDHILRNNWIFEMESYLEKFKKYKLDDEFEQMYIEYWCLGLRYQMLSKRLQELVFGRVTVDCAQKYVGVYPRMIKRFFTDLIPVLESDFEQWSNDMMNFL